MNNVHQQQVKLIWSIAELLRGDYKPHEYADVILPLVVLRRLDLAIAPTRATIRAAYEAYQGRLENLDGVLIAAAGNSSLYNHSFYDWQRLLDAPPDLAENLIAYLNGFSPQVRDIIEHFDFRRQVQRLKAAGLLFKVIQAFDKVELHPATVDNLAMGYIFEELIRRFGEQYNETAGEHFTPREVIQLMVRLVLSGDESILYQPSLIRTLYDPACGTGGMLTEASNFIKEQNPRAQLLLFGQELNPTAYAVAKSDILLKGEQPDRIVFGNSFTEDGHRGQRFNFMLSNPPFGVDWRKVQDPIEKERDERGFDGRFGAGTPRINDGALLFLQHMLAKMKQDEEGSRIVIVFNGSPLFTGDAGSGESEIRRWILENDWLEAIVALPDQLFYNTGISTYLWLLTNRKAPARRGKVQLVNAVGYYEKMRKSLGNKRNEIAPAHLRTITTLYSRFEVNERCQIFDNRDFGYRKIRVERPLRLNFQASPARIARLEEERAFQSLATSRKKQHSEAWAEEIAAGIALQAEIRAILATLPDTLFQERPPFVAALQSAARTRGVKLSAPLTKAILAALSERDEEAAPCCDEQGQPEPDSELRDYENVPLTELVQDYFAREVQPHVPDAWLDESFTDPRDNQIGRVGYEIPFNRYFYHYQPPRALPQIEADLRAIEADIIALLRDVAGLGDEVR